MQQALAAAIIKGVKLKTRTALFLLMFNLVSALVTWYMGEGSRDGDSMAKCELFCRCIVCRTAGSYKGVLLSGNCAFQLMLTVLNT